MHPSLSSNLIKKQQKYNKITQQKKFHLLTLIYKDRLPIRQAAQIAGINFLTAKTIIFFHKNHCKSYRFDINKQNEGRLGECHTATFSTIRKITDVGEKLFKPKTRIQVICSIGNVLSPPRKEHRNSPTTCSYMQDSFTIKAPPINLQEAQIWPNIQTINPILTPNISNQPVQPPTFSLEKAMALSLEVLSGKRLTQESYEVQVKQQK